MARVAVVRVAVVVVARVAVLKMVTAEARCRRYPERSGRCAREMAEMREMHNGDGKGEEFAQW